MAAGPALGGGGSPRPRRLGLDHLRISKAPSPPPEHCPHPWGARGPSFPGAAGQAGSCITVGALGRRQARVPRRRLPRSGGGFHQAGGGPQPAAASSGLEAPRCHFGAGSIGPSHSGGGGAAGRRDPVAPAARRCGWSSGRWGGAGVQDRPPFGVGQAFICTSSGQAIGEAAETPHRQQEPGGHGERWCGAPAGPHRHSAWVPARRRLRRHRWSSGACKAARAAPPCFLGNSSSSSSSHSPFCPLSRWP